MRDYAKLIGHLIAKAESAQAIGSLAEAETYRLKAEALMREYRIAEEDTIAKDEFSILPVRREVVLMETGGYSNSLRHHYIALWNEIKSHMGLRSVQEYRWLTDGDAAIVAVTYGYESDFKVAEFYWTAARLVFLARIDARVNPDLSDQENCYFMRNSGMKRNDIANLLWGSAYNDGAAHGKVQKFYLAECAKRGEQPRVSGRGIQVAQYREAYANTFVSEFGWRLREARDGVDTAQGGLVLKGRKERVDEAFYAAYPKARPASAEERAAAHAAWIAREVECADCRTTKSKSGKCRRHRPTEFSKTEYARWDRQQNSPAARAGRVNGAAAARSVDVQRTAGARTQRAESAPERPALGG